MDEKPKKKTSSAKIDKEVLTDSIVDALIKYD